MRKRRGGCIGCAVPFFGAAAIYLFVRIAPASWYMPRHSSIAMGGPVAIRPFLGVSVYHNISYDDYSEGIWGVMNDGPRVHHVSESSVVARITVNDDLSLTLSGIAAGGYSDLGFITAWGGAIAYVERGKSDNTARLALFDGEAVLFRDGVVQQNILRLDDEDVYLSRTGMRFGRLLTDEERSVIAGRGMGELYCRIPQTRAYINYYGDVRTTNVMLYTVIPAGGLVTNIYPCPLAEVGIVTAMGKPEDALFASFDRIPGPGRPSTRVDRIIYTVWSRRGVVRKIEVLSGVEPTVDVDLYEVDGSLYLVYCHEKKVRRRAVTLGVTFVDLDSGRQIERDVTILIPPGVGRACQARPKAIGVKAIGVKSQHSTN